MSEFIDIISPKALAELQKANAELVTMVGNVKKVNENMINAKTPSGSDSALKLLTAEYDKQAKVIQQLQKQLEQLSNAKKQNNVRTSEEIVNQRALAQSADRQTRATSALVGAYANLNARHQQASITLQNLIVRGKTAEQTQRAYNRELKNAQNEFNKLNTKVISADRAVGRFNRNVGNYPTQAIRGIRDLVGAFGVVGGVSLFAMMTKDIIQTGKELQGLNNALMLVTETQGNMAEQQAFLQKISEAYGLEIKGLTQQFTQFYVSAKDKISGREIQQIFQSVSKAGASMGLSVQQQERAFLALNQMMSKGSIQAEELRGQLGEALPGAFGIMAKAVGVTEAELGKMMKAGELLASDVLPKFARQLEITYGIENIDRIETMTTATNRLSNAWTSFVGAITSNDGVISKSLTGLLNILSKVVDGFRQMTLSKEELNKELNNNAIQKQVDGYKEYLKTLDLTNKAEIEAEQAVTRKDLLRNPLMRKEIELLKARRLEIIAMQRTQGIKSTDAQELKDIDKKLKAYPILIELNIERSRLLREMIDDANKVNKVTKEETSEIKNNTKAKKENVKETRELIEGSVEWLEREIQLLKEKQSQLSTTGEEYQAFNVEIQTLIGTLEMLVGKTKEVKDSVKEMGTGISDFDLSDAGVDKWYDEMAQSFQQPLGDGDTWQDQFNQWATVGVDAIQTVQQAQNAYFESQLSNLERERDIALLFAGQSADAKAEIDRQYDEKRRKILERQAKQDKAYAIVNSIINTATAVVRALPNIPLSVAIGLIGTAQTALIASQQIPQFYKGTENAPEGYAWTQERGAEVILDKSGNIKSFGSSKGAELTYLNQGDKVLDANKSLIFNKELNGILNNNGITSVTQSNQIDLSPLNKRLDNLASVIKNKSEWQYISDRQGERVFRKEQGNKALILSNRLRIKG